MTSLSQPFDVAVIGAGFAGMSAAVALSMAGKRVVLIEKRHTLGGRVHSTTDRKTGDVLDNGPHLFVGAYHHARRLLRTLGTEHHMRFQPRCEMNLRDEEGDIVFRHRALPGDLGLALGFAKMRGVSLADVFAMRHLLPMSRNADHTALDTITCEQWFNDLGVPASVRRLFLDPVTIASVNDAPERSSASLMARVLAQTFSGGAANGGLGFILGPHSVLFEEAIESHLQKADGALLAGKRAAQVIFDGDDAKGVALMDGTEIRANNVIVAVPHRNVPRLIDQSHSTLEEIASLGSAPIINVHLWLDRPVLDKPLVGLVGKQTQWVFALDHLWSHPGQPHRHIGVISGAREESSQSHEQLVTQMMKDLADLYPTARGAEVVRSMVINDRHSTMAPAPGNQAKRPGPQSPWPHLWWAGDWTNTGLPSTIESACQSGHKCASAVLAVTQ